MIAENCRLRNSAADPALVAQLYEEFLQIKAESEALRASRNENSAAMKVSGLVHTCASSLQLRVKSLGGCPGGGLQSQAESEALRTSRNGNGAAIKVRGLVHTYVRPLRSECAWGGRGGGAAVASRE